MSFTGLRKFTEKIGSGSTPRGGKSSYVSSGIPFIRSQNVQSGFMELDTVAFIDKETHEKMRGTQLQPKDVLLNITGASIGRSAVVPDNFSEGNVNQHVCIIRLDRARYHPKFLCEFLNSTRGQYLIDSVQSGGSRQGLNFQEVGDLTIPDMDIKEQERIAEILSDADAAIATTEQLEAVASRRVLGLQHILISRPLHAREWDAFSFCEALEQKNEKSTYSNEYPVLTSSRRGLFLQDEYFSRQVASSDNTGYLIVRKGDFTYRAMTDDDTFVFNQLLQHNIGIVSPAYAVFGVKNADPIFFRHLLNCKAFGFEITKIAQGGTRKSLKFSALKSLDFCLPRFEKQAEIGRALLAAEQEAIHLGNTITALKKQKRGLMQQLLTGKLRVPIKKTKEKAKGR